MPPSGNNAVSFDRITSSLYTSRPARFCASVWPVCDGDPFRVSDNIAKTRQEDRAKSGTESTKKRTESENGWPSYDGQLITVQQVGHAGEQRRKPARVEEILHEVLVARGSEVGLQHSGAMGVSDAAQREQ